MVSCVGGKFGVLGSYFFEDKDDTPVTITSAHYIEMLENFLKPQLNKLAADVKDIWFQQDGATARTALPEGALSSAHHLSLWRYSLARMVTRSCTM